MELEDVLEVLNYISHPQGTGLPRPGPKPLVSPFGPGYSMHPELSRSGAGYLLSHLVKPGIVAGVPITLFAANYYVIEHKVPEHQRHDMWQMFSSGLSGTVGLGSGSERFVN